MLDAAPLMLFWIGLVLAVIVASIVGEWFRKQKIKNRLVHRQSFDDEQFAQAFYSGNPAKADIAVRVRKVLAEDLDVALDAVRPEDSLNEQLGVGLESNPVLFLSLEDEFAIRTDCDDLDVFESTVKQLDSFADLVAYVQKKIEKSQTEKARPESSLWFTERIYERLARIVPPICLAGIGLAVIGSMIGVERLWLVGSGVFMLGVALLLISVFSIGLENLTTELRQQGLKWAREHPYRTLWIAFIAGVMLYFSFRLLRWALPVIWANP